MTDLDKLADAVGHMRGCFLTDKTNYLAWHERPANTKPFCTCGARDTARRVVEAMRILSEAAEEAGTYELCWTGGEMIEIPPDRSWRAVIDHILKETPCDT